MIQGTYSGTGARAGMPGVNTPASRVQNAGWTLIYWDGYTDGNDFVPPAGTQVHANILMFGTVTNPGSCCETYDKSMTPTDMWNIDTKVDDGYVMTGKVTLLSHWLSSCVTTNNPSTAVYNTTINDVVCSPTFVTDF